MATPQAMIRGQSRRRRQLSDAALLRLFIFPTLILIILMNIFPLFYSLYLSFTDYSAIARQAPNWVGFKNYADLLSDKQMWIYFANSGRYALLSVGLQTLVGFGLALLLNEKFKGSGFLTTLILVPMMLSPAVVGLFWKLIYHPSSGIFNYIVTFGHLNAIPDILASPKLALWGIIIVDVWMWSPFVMLLCLSGLGAIPDYIYEAAAIDRASWWRQFWRITLPQVAPLLMIAVLFRTIEAFKAFDVVMPMTAGGPGEATELIALNLYRQAFGGQWRTGRASALAYIILIIIIGISNVYIRFLNKIRGD